jgi:CheY-like chemotaxis protein
MRILIAEDETTSRTILRSTLEKWGFEVVSTENGAQALNVLLGENAPGIAILDWMMPEMDGPTVCQQVRERPTLRPPYLLLLTSRDATEDIVAGLKNGADDYLTKPFKPSELHARLGVGLRMIDLQRTLADRVERLETSLREVKHLQNLLPFCACCKQIRDDWEYWNKVDQYLANHQRDTFTHDVCPTCYATHVRPELEMLWDQGAAWNSSETG